MLSRLVAWLLALGMLSASPAPAQELDGATSEDPTQAAAREVDIMRRVLEKAVAHEVRRKEDPRSRYSALALSAYLRSSEAVESARKKRGGDGDAGAEARGFLLPGGGAMFSLEVAVDVTVKEAESGKDKGGARDLWEEARREAAGVRGAVYGELQGASEMFGARAKGTVTRTLDKEQMDAGLQAVLTMLARHGRKLESVDEGPVVVALTFRPRTGSAGQAYTMFDTFGTANFESGKDSAGDKGGDKHPGAKAYARGVWVGSQAGTTPKPQRVVLKIPSLADLSARSLGQEATAEAVRKQARILCY